MAAIHADRVLETSSTSGIGAYTLAGEVLGFRTFSSVLNIAIEPCDYFAEDVDANGALLGGWEVGTAQWSAGNILTPIAVTSSSNSNAKVAWAAGMRRIGLGLSAARLKAISDEAAVFAMFFGAD